ncbi:MAG: hypothetical protein ABI665_27220 [Vicinamibacterales bacterium]
MRRAWGFKAATRALHIFRSGRDVAMAGAYKGRSPSTMPVEVADRVPGAPVTGSTLFDVSQTLAWLAKERTDVQEQTIWREQIPSLIGHVTR